MLRRETRTALLQKFLPAPASQTSAAMLARTLTVSHPSFRGTAALCNMYPARQWVKLSAPCVQTSINPATPQPRHGPSTAGASMESVDSRTSTPSAYNRRSMDASSLRADMRGLLFGSKTSRGEPHSHSPSLHTSLPIILRPDGASQEPGLSYSDL